MASTTVKYTNGTEITGNVSWTNPSNAYDGNESSYASCSLNNQKSNILKGTVNNNSQSSGDVVRVFAGAKWDVKAASGSSGSYTDGIIFKVYLDSNSATYETELSYDDSWNPTTAWVEITSFLPSWTWDDINNLDIGFQINWTYSNDADFRCYQIYLKVIYASGSAVDLIISYNSGYMADDGNVDWTNPSYAWDKNDSNRASVTLAKDDTSEKLCCTANDNTKSSDDILLVYLGVKGYSSSYLSWTIQPKFNGSTLGNKHNGNAPTSEENVWFDITDDKNAPATWTWNDINNLDCVFKVSNEGINSNEDTYINQFYIKVTYDSPGVDLTVSELNHSHSLKQSSLTQNHSLTTSELSHNHSLEQSSLTQNHSLTTSELSHNHSLEQSTLTQNHDISISELGHNHSLEQSSLTQNHSLTTSELSHSHSLEQSSLTQNHDISISELGHNHSLEQSSLSQIHNITVSELSHSHSLEQSTLTQTHSLTVSELSHDHTLEQTEIGQIHALNIDKLNHEHLLDETTLTQIYVLNVDSLEHQHLLDTVSLGTLLNIDSLLHSHLLDESTLGQIHQLTVESLEHAQNLEQTSLSQIHNLSVVALDHGHIIDVVQVGQIHDLSVLDLHHNHSVEKVTVGQIHNLQVEKLEHQQLLDELSIGQIHNLSVSELEHSHIVTVPQISQIHSLQLLSLEHNHTLDESTIIQAHKLQVQGLRSEQIIDDSQIGQIHNLNIESLDHEHTLDIVTIDQLIILIAERLVHQHLLDKANIVIPFRCIKISPLQTTFDLKSGWSRTYQVKVCPMSFSSSDIESTKKVKCITFNFTVKEETYDRS